MDECTTAAQQTFPTSNPTPEYILIERMEQKTRKKLYMEKERKELLSSQFAFMDKAGPRDQGCLVSHRLALGLYRIVLSIMLTVWLWRTSVLHFERFNVR